jgi:transposase
MSTAMGHEAELDSLRAEVARLRAERDAAHSSLDQMKTAHDAATSRLQALATAKEKLEKKVSQLEFKVDDLLKKLFGKSSERFDPNQILFEFAATQNAEALAVPAPPHADEAPDGEDRPKDPPSKKRGHGARRLPANLKRVPVEYTPDPAELTCACGCAKKSIGSPEITERLDYTPSSVFIVEHIRHRFRCPTCHDETAIAPLPPAPTAIEDGGERGRAEAGLLAYVVTSKYGDHLPLNRLQSILSREGIYLHRSTLCDWVADTAKLLWPVAEAVRQQIVTRPVVGVDETGLLVVYDKKDPIEGTRKARIWAYRGLAGEIFYMVSETKGTHDTDGPKRVLGQFRGFVQADAAGTFDDLFKDGTRLEVGCNAHARRKFFEAKSSHPLEAGYVLATYKKVYEIEARVRAASPEERRAARLAESKPILDALDSWLDELATSPALLSGTPLAKAVGYSRNHRLALRRFLDDGRLEADNNAVERALRLVAVGRKNWLFAGSPQGADDAATLYTLVGSCKDLGVDPWRYLRDVIKRRASDQGIPASELTPRAWKAAAPPTG